MGKHAFALTPARQRILETANGDKLGLVDRPYLTGFERVSWDRNAAVLVEWGMLERYRHGGYEITEAGRRLLKGLEQ